MFSGAVLPVAALLLAAGLPAWGCASDWDCSLAGECVSGSCHCDAWTSGADCSYLNLLPVDKSKLGLKESNVSSWGGNAVRHSDGLWHLFAAEINCGRGAACGLSDWSTHSQVGHAVASSPEGPYRRVGLALPKQHHNPTVHVVDGQWFIHSISCCGNGQISVANASSPYGPWTVNDKLFPATNPGPLPLANGSMALYYRSSAKGVGPCSQESIGLAACDSPTGPCRDVANPLFTHTSEDPSVFVDKRGNFHMLTNGLPGGCKPKQHAGGHAWSRDGRTWSEPRIGAFNTTVIFTDGSSTTFDRRERPQMILDPDSGEPLVFTSGVTGDNSFVPDTFTLAQRVQQDTS